MFLNGVERVILKTCFTLLVCQFLTIDVAGGFQGFQCYPSRPIGLVATSNSPNTFQSRWAKPAINPGCVYDGYVYVYYGPGAPNEPYTGTTYYLSYNATGLVGCATYNIEVWAVDHSTAAKVVLPLTYTPAQTQVFVQPSLSDFKLQSATATNQSSTSALVQWNPTHCMTTYSASFAVTASTVDNNTVTTCEQPFCVGNTCYSECDNLTDCCDDGYTFSIQATYGTGSYPTSSVIISV